MRRCALGPTASRSASVRDLLSRGTFDFHGLPRFQPAAKHTRTPRAAAMTSENNGNVIGLMKPTSSSNEDLSEYTDADESISAPTEILAEFLSAVMLKDYVTALKYCKLILQYEPNNATAKEFYPLIIDKLKLLSIKNDGNSNSNSNSNDSEDEEASEGSASSEPESSATDETSEDQEEEEEDQGQEEAAASGGGAGDNKCSKGSDGDATTGSYSSLEDDDAGDGNAATAEFKTPIGNAEDVGNGNTLYTISGLSSNTAFQNKLTNSNPMQPLPFGTSSDSESPTEPITLQTVALLRARVVPN